MIVVQLIIKKVGKTQTNKHDYIWTKRCVKIVLEQTCALYFQRQDMVGKMTIFSSSCLQNCDFPNFRDVKDAQLKDNDDHSLSQELNSSIFI